MVFDDYPGYWIDSRKKPPLGVMPRGVWNYTRIRNLVDAVSKRLETGKVDEEVLGWLKESVELAERNLTS